MHPGDLVGVTFAPPAPGQRTVPGIEITGVVVAVGPGVSTPPVGSPTSNSMATRLNFSTFTMRSYTGWRIDNSRPLSRMTVRHCSGV
jgi:hypothetical protein